MYRSVRRCLLAVHLFLLPVVLSAQGPVTTQLRNTQPDLRELTQRAGLIFAGTVTSITPIHSRDGSAVESVEIRFQIERSVRGPRVGQSFAIREWAGLWMAGERYRVGERVMLFLHAPGKLGLTSQVGGRAGRFEVDRNGQVMVSPAPVQRTGSPSAVTVKSGLRVALRQFTSNVRKLAEE